MTQAANFDFLFIFVLILHLMSGKVTNVLVEKFSTSEIISQKSQVGSGKHPPKNTSPSAFGLIGACKHTATINSDSLTGFFHLTRSFQIDSNGPDGSIQLLVASSGMCCSVFDCFIPHLLMKESDCHLKPGSHMS